MVACAVVAGDTGAVHAEDDRLAVEPSVVLDLVEGTMIYMTNTADKSRTSAGIYMHENKLYVIEGTVPAGYPEPGFFQQSIRWLDENGNGIRYQTLYHNGFPKPPTGRGAPGQGQGQGQGQGAAQPR